MQREFRRVEMNDGAFWHGSFTRLSNERPNHSLNHQFLRRDEVRVFWIFCFQEGLVVFEHESLERAFPVNERRHHLAVPWFRPVLVERSQSIRPSVPRKRSVTRWS